MESKVDVRRLYVTMHDACAMGRIECIGDAERDVDEDRDLQ